MADNVTVSNAPSSVNTDIPVRSLDKSGKQIQVVAIDFGGAGAENLTVPNFATQATLSSIDTKVPSNGQKTMAGSLPVVLASNQSILSANVDGSFVGINDISNIVGQTNSANSIPVVLATNQSAISVTLPTASGAAPSFATVGTTSASVGLSTATYQKLIFCNTSVNTIALSFNGAAVASRGIVLAPGEKVLLDGPISVTTVNAIASAASSNLAIQAFT